MEPIESYELLKTEEEREKEFQGKEKSERFKAQKECNPVLLFEDGGAVTRMWVVLRIWEGLLLDS